MSGSNDTFLDAGLGTNAATAAGSPESIMDTYTVMVGQRLRKVREERLYSLSAVERESNEEFKSSVIGAYERGERIMTVQRLDRLAQFYDVPITHLLPQDDDRAALEVQRPVLRVRLHRLFELEGEPFEHFRVLVDRVQHQRGDHESETVTLREEDLDAVASMFNVPADEMADRLVLLDLIA